MCWPPKRPSLHSALLAAKTAGYSHVSIDGTLIETDRVSTPGPIPEVDLWWSGKHHNHDGNIQVVTVPDGWPIWTSDVRPGREHDTTAVRTHTEILPALAPGRWRSAHHRRSGVRRRIGHDHRGVQETEEWSSLRHRAEVQQGTLSGSGLSVSAATPCSR
jgi:hypothetical protein